MSDWIALLAIGYPLAALTVGIISRIEVLEHASWCPKGAELGLACVFGLFWPSTVAYAAGWAVGRAATALARSFAVLYRHWRLRRVEMPRATARKRTSGGQP